MTMVITPIGDTDSARFLVQKSDETLTVMLKDRLHLGLVSLSSLTQLDTACRRHYRPRCCPHGPEWAAGTCHPPCMDDRG